MSTLYQPGTYIITETGEVRHMPAPFHAPEGSVTLQPEPPEFDPSTHQAVWQDGKWAVQSLSPEVLGQKALASVRLQMASILEALELEDQSMLWPSRVAIEQALDRGQVGIALTLVANQPLPPDRPDLEAAKAEILALFPG